MKQGSEAFKQAPYQPEEEQPEPEKKMGKLYRFPKKPWDMKSEEEIAKDYEAYKKIPGGTLSLEEYREVMKRAATETSAGFKWSSYAHSYARTGGINLSPETVTIYGILRDPEDEQYSVQGDQKLLAEALRLVGDEASLNTYINKLSETNPNLFK